MVRGSRFRGGLYTLYIWGALLAVKWPGPTDRVAVLGRTGSGKTTLAAWLLSGHDFNEQPAVIINTKGDRLLLEIADIDGVQTIDVNDTPGETGLYHIRPRPDQAAELDALFHRIWEKENCLVYIDEGYMVEITDWFNALLTQGRSKHISMIVLSQRPAWISKYVFSECDFISLFNLQILDDRKTAAGFVPVDRNYRLAKYESYWYNVSDNELFRFAPVPNSAVILDTFRAKFPPKQAADDAIDAPEVRQVTRRRVV